MKKLSVFLFFIFAVKISLAQQDVNYESPKSFIISGIEVEGAEHSDVSSVVSMSGLLIGATINIPGPEIAEAIKKLWKQNLFSDVTIEVDNILGGKAFLVIKVTERGRISKTNFDGISKSNADDLHEKINFVRGTIFTETKRKAAVRIIKNYFQEKGFYNTTVDITTEPDALNTVLIKIKVDKGPRIKIKKINIEGNQEIPDKKLKGRMKETREMKIWRIFARSKFIKGSYNEDKKKIVDFYNSKGFRDAYIVQDTVFSVKPNRLQVNMQVYEGRKYYFRNIGWSGNYKYDTKYLANLLGIKRGDVYDASTLDRRLSMDPSGTDVTSLYMDDGYLFFNITPVEVQVEGDSIDLELRIYEGPQAVIDKIIIEGNTKTSDHVILREIRTLPGNKFSRADVIRSQREIANLGYFNPETMGVQPIPNVADGTVDIKYTVEEKPSDQLQIQGGWGGSQRDINGNRIGGGLVGTLSVTFNNFSSRRFFDKKSWNPLPAGDGQRLSLAFQTTGTSFQNYSINFMEPWLGGKKPNSLGVGAYYSVQRSPTTDYKMGILGTSIDFGTRMKFPDDYFRSYTSFSYKHYDLQNAGRTFLGIENGNINIFSIRQAFDRSSIDAPIYSKTGSSISFSVQATPPYSLFNNLDYVKLREEQKNDQIYKFLEFHKWKFDASWFLPVKGQLVVNAKLRYGFLGFYNKDVGLSPFERFYLGGSGLSGFNLDGREIIALRGYRDREVGPRNNELFLTGGTIFNKFTIELRQLVTPPKSQSVVVWVHGFLEAGNAWANFKDFNPFSMKRSAGTGIRLFLPMFGLIGVDYGYGFDPIISPNDGMHKSQFHFVFGQQF